MDELLKSYKAKYTRGERFTPAPVRLGSMNPIGIKNVTSKVLIFRNSKTMKSKFLNFKIRNYKKFWGGIEIVRSEVYILKMGNMKMGVFFKILISKSIKHSWKV